MTNKTLPEEKTETQIDSQQEETLDNPVDDTLSKEIDEIFEKGASIEENPEETKQEEETTKEEKPLKEEETPTKDEEEETPEKKEEKPKEETKEEQPEEKVEESEPTEEEKKLLDSLGLQKFKSVKDALEAYKNLESAYGRVQTMLSNYEKGIIPQEMKDGIQGALNIASKPRVKIEPPDPTLYTNENGEFDIVNYLRDTLEDIIVDLQKSIVFGGLSSAIYTVQKAAQLETYNELKSKIEQDTEAVNIANKLTEEFPILNDEKVFQKVSRAWAGEAQITGKKLTLDDFRRITSEVLSDIKIENTLKKEAETPIERGGIVGSSPGEEKPTKKDKVEEAVDEILDSYLAKSSASIF